MLNSKSRGLPYRTECRLPCIAWGQPQAYKFALYFGEIDGAAGGRAQHLGSKLVRARFTIYHGKQSGSVEHDLIHSEPPRAVRQSTRRRWTYPASDASGQGVELARRGVSAS